MDHSGRVYKTMQLASGMGRPRTSLELYLFQKNNCWNVEGIGASQSQDLGWSRLDLLDVRHCLFLLDAPRACLFIVNLFSRSAENVGKAEKLAISPVHFRASLVAQSVKYMPVIQETLVQFLDQEDPLEKGEATHSSILAWWIPWKEKLGRLQYMGSQRVHAIYGIA